MIYAAGINIRCYWALSNKYIVYGLQIVGAGNRQGKLLARLLLWLEEDLSNSQNASRGGLLQEQDKGQCITLAHKIEYLQAEPLMMICIDARGASCPLNAWYGRHSAS